MQSVPFILILRLFISLVIGVLISLKIQAFVRELIIRCLPMSYRIAKKSYFLQIRIPMAISVGLVMSAIIFMSEMIVRFYLKKEKIEENQSTNIKKYPLTKEKIASLAPETQLPKKKKIVHSSNCLHKQFYAQVAAFNNIRQAKEEKKNWNMIKPFLSWIVTTDKESYKVILGPFSDQSATSRYIKERGLKAYPISGHDLHFLIE